MDKKPSLKSGAEVRFYDGYRGRQVPRSVRIGRREQHIIAILSQKRVLDRDRGTVSEVFECRLDNGHKVEITVDLEGNWSIQF